MSPWLTCIDPCAKASEFAVLQNNIRWVVFEVEVEKINDVPIVQLAIKDPCFTFEALPCIDIQSQELFDGHDLPCSLIKRLVDATKGSSGDFLDRKISTTHCYFSKILLSNFVNVTAKVALEDRVTNEPAYSD